MKNKSVRIHHPTLRNCVFTLTQMSRPYPQPFPCPMCGIDHTFKTFHLNLNEFGDVCVHEEIYELFKTEGILEELSATKEVTPAPTIITMGSTVQPQTVMSRELGIIRMNGHKEEG